MSATDHDLIDPIQYLRREQAQIVLQRLQVIRARI